MKYQVEPLRMINPASGGILSLYVVGDQNGNMLCMADGDGRDPIRLTFPDHESAELVLDALESRTTSSSNSKMRSKRVSSGEYEIDTEKGSFKATLDKGDGGGDTWRVHLPSGDVLDHPFKTKRDALEAIAHTL